MDAQILYHKAQRKISIIYSSVQEWLNHCMLRVLKRTYERCAYIIIVSHGKDKIEIKLRDTSFEAKLLRAGIEFEKEPLKRNGKSYYRRSIPRVSLLRWYFSFEQEVAVRGTASMEVSPERCGLMTVKADFDSNGDKGKSKTEHTMPLNAPAPAKIRLDSKVLAEARNDYEKTQDIFEEFLLNDENK